MQKNLDVVFLWGGELILVRLHQQFFRMILWNYLAMVGENSDLDSGMIISSPWDPMVASDSIEVIVREKKRIKHLTYSN